MREVWILSAKRTPIGRFQGGLAPLTAVDLGLHAAEAAVGAVEGVDPDRLREAIDLAVFGCARQAGVRPNPARQIAVRLGAPISTPAYTVNMACASGLESVIRAAQAIRAGEADVAIAGGIESMSNVPHLLMGAREGYRLGHQRVVDSMYQDGFHCALADRVMGETSDIVAREVGITREEADAFAQESQARCERARREGAFEREVAPIDVPGRKGPTRVAADEHPRDGVTVERLAKLPALFSDDGVTTAGNASGINDAGACLVLAERSWAESHGLAPRAIVGAHAHSGVEPERMGLSPVPTVRALCERAGVAPGDFDLIELNEAFAAQALACIRGLGLDAARVNPAGGAIALGHPVGCTGARLVVTLLHALERAEARLGLATLCVSGGLGVALAVRRPS